MQFVRVRSSGSNSVIDPYNSSSTLPSSSLQPSPPSSGTSSHSHSHTNSPHIGGIGSTRHIITPSASASTGSTHRTIRMSASISPPLNHDDNTIEMGQLSTDKLLSSPSSPSLPSLSSSSASSLRHTALHIHQPIIQPRNDWKVFDQGMRFGCMLSVSQNNTSWPQAAHTQENRVDTVDVTTKCNKNACSN